MKQYRNYSNCNYNKVEQTYKYMLENQTIEYVIKMKEKYLSNSYKTYNIWFLIDKLDKIVDESDPDNDLPQIVHSYQTALSIKNNYLENKNLKNIPIKNLLEKMNGILYLKNIRMNIILH